MKTYSWLAAALAALMALTVWTSALAAGPEDRPAQDSGRRVGLVSTTVECVAVAAGAPEVASASVRLEWEGQIDQAFLVLAAAGSEGGHSIYVNGQRIGTAPVRPGGQPCQAGSPAAIFAPTDEISLPVEALVNGENVITLTNDANAADDWTAADLHLEIHGVLSGPPVALLENPSLVTASPPDLTSQDIRAMAVVTGGVVLTSSYENTITHTVWYQQPDGYTGSSTPLVVALHGYGGTGLDVINGSIGSETNARGWLLAAPDMHGRYYQNTGQYAFAWPGAQHDVIDAMEYMVATYNVDTSRIYVVGGSMGGEATTVMAAKYPDLFAAAAAWKPITNLGIWYYESWPNAQSRMENETGGTPPDVPFAYQQRSAIKMPQNSRLIPLKLWHDVQDNIVVVAHSISLETAINSWNPLLPVVLDQVDTGSDPNNLCILSSASDKHCYSPPPLTNSFPTTITLTTDSRPVTNLFDYLASYTLNSQPPPSVTIRTDESKPYYWLNVTQTGGDHWSEVEASYNSGSKIVTATISDTQPLTVAFNLGSTSIAGPAGISQPGLSMSATLYRVEVDDTPVYTQSYVSGYLTVTNVTQAVTITAVFSESQRVYLPIVTKNN